jgi:hypothetical protein
MPGTAMDPFMLGQEHKNEKMMFVWHAALGSSVCMACRGVAMEMG